MGKKKYDFCGWATKNNIKCSDGLTILKDAFKHNDGMVVPLVWNHMHNSPENILGHALLENRDDGVYAFCTFNDTESGVNAKTLVEHGDIASLSILANKLKRRGKAILHGAIREVSLVLAGANPGAVIDMVISHGEESDDMAVIYTGEDIVHSHSDGFYDDYGSESLLHSDDKKPEDKKKPAEDNPENEETVQNVVDSMTEKQKNVMYGLIGAAMAEKDDEEGDETMKHNVFDNDGQMEGRQVLSHSAIAEIIADGKRYGSLRESFLQHAADYGIEQIDYLFPEAKSPNNQPDFIKRDTGWVVKVMDAIHRTPFSRIKSLFANITEDDARAKGYIKGNMKKEEVFGLLKRVTQPTTVYKKQKLDRDDVVDITDFDVVAWIKAEMRMMLDEEIARAILIGDGRSSSSDEKINESNIRPVALDADLYTLKPKINIPAGTTEDARAKMIIRAIIKSFKGYKGSGSATFYTTEDMLTDMLLIEDVNGRIIYDSVDKLARTLRVKEIVTVPVMEGVKGANGGKLLGVIANLNDYNVGADKGGEINMFDDFDIDYNQMKYLIETRCSGALVKPYSAIALEEIAA